MAEWGPAYASEASPSSELLRCGECGATAPASTTTTVCYHCGGTLRPPAGVDELAMSLVQTLVPPSLVETLASGAAEATDEGVLEELPLVRIQPHVHLRVLAPSTDACATDAPRTDAPVSAPATDSSAPATDSSGADRVLMESRGTGSTFGTLLSDLDAGISAELILAEPLDGSTALANGAAVSGRIVVMERGGVSFVDKVRWAEAAGAVGCIVIQSPTGVWPFSMSDTQQVGNDVTLPSLMMRHLDGVGLRAALEAAAAKGELRPRGHAIARDHRTTCAVCLQEMIASTMAVRLPCGHSFHEECAREWLRNVSPRCLKR